MAAITAETKAPVGATGAPNDTITAAALAAKPIGEFSVMDIKGRIRIIFVGLGKPYAARQFIKRYPYGEHIYVDPSTTLYRRLGFGAKAKFYGSALLCGQILRAIALCCCKCWCPCNTGGVTQNGGLLVVSPTGDILYQHTEADGGDRADLMRVWPIVDRAVAALLPATTATTATVAATPAPAPATAASAATTATSVPSSAP